MNLTSFFIKLFQGAAGCFAERKQKLYLTAALIAAVSEFTACILS